MSEIQKLVPKTSRLLGMVHDKNFRPSIAPRSERVMKRDRVLFEQRGHALDAATVVRAPLCLMSEGDTGLFRRVSNSEDGLKMMQTLTENSPTAATLFDSFRQINSNPEVVWFSEDSTFAQTVSRAIKVNPDVILPMLQKQSSETAQLLQNLIRKHPSEPALRVIKFSDKETIDSIIEAIHIESQKLGFQGKDRKKLRESSAAVVGSTHALFPLIISLLGFKGPAFINNGQLAAVQGPVHLETNPPHWSSNENLATVVRFVSESAADWNMPHRSLLPCLFKGEPIGEFSALDEDSPQLRRDQRWKFEKWIERNNPFPLSNNPIFGHAIGLMDIPEIGDSVNALLELDERHRNLQSNSSADNLVLPGGVAGLPAWDLSGIINDKIKEIKVDGKTLNQNLASEIDAVLSRIGFWK